MLIAVPRSDRRKSHTRFCPRIHAKEHLALGKLIRTQARPVAGFRNRTAAIIVQDEPRFVLVVRTSAKTYVVTTRKILTNMFYGCYQFIDTGITAHTDRHSLVGVNSNVSQLNTRRRIIEAQLHQQERAYSCKELSASICPYLTASTFINVAFCFNDMFRRTIMFELPTHASFSVRRSCNFNQHVLLELRRD